MSPAQQVSLKQGSNVVGVLAVGRTHMIIPRAGKTRLRCKVKESQAGKRSCCVAHSGSSSADTKLRMVRMMGVSRRPPKAPPSSASPISSATGGTTGSCICCTASSTALTAVTCLSFHAFGLAAFGGFLVGPTLVVKRALFPNK